MLAYESGLAPQRHPLPAAAGFGILPLLRRPSGKPRVGAAALRRRHRQSGAGAASVRRSAMAGDRSCRKCNLARSGRLRPMKSIAFVIFSSASAAVRDRRLAVRGHSRAGCAGDGKRDQDAGQRAAHHRPGVGGGGLILIWLIRRLNPFRPARMCLNSGPRFLPVFGRNFDGHETACRLRRKRRWAQLSNRKPVFPGDLTPMTLALAGSFTATSPLNADCLRRAYCRARAVALPLRAAARPSRAGRKTSPMSPRR